MKMADECDVCEMPLDDAAIRIGDRRFCDAVCLEMAKEGDDDEGSGNGLARAGRTRGTAVAALDDMARASGSRWGVDDHGEFYFEKGENNNDS